MEAARRMTGVLTARDARQRLKRLDTMGEEGAAAAILLALIWRIERPVSRLDHAVCAWARRVSAGR